VGIQFIPTTRNQGDEILETDFTKTFDAQIIFENCLKNHITIAIATTQSILGIIKFKKKIGLV